MDLTLAQPASLQHQPTLGLDIGQIVGRHRQVSSRFQMVRAQHLKDTFLIAVGVFDLSPQTG